MKECFYIKKFQSATLKELMICRDIISDYESIGIKLTLRQLYYQLVTKNLITNEEKSYQKLSRLIGDARLAGLIDWDAIEDRLRQPHSPPEFRDLPDLLEAACFSYRLPRWEGQEWYAELWVEKDALASVLLPIARRYHVTLMVNRGYSSLSAMYESAKRFRSFGRKPILFYLGDHDPSGEDMVRDIKDRMTLLGVHDLIVEKLALTTDQVETFHPPPNPTKMKDPRAAEYIEKHGYSCWEVDALPPESLTSIIESAIDGILDRNLFDAVVEKEEIDKKKLKAFGRRNK